MRRSVFLIKGCYECTLSHPGRNYTPCAWFAFSPARAPEDLIELDRLWAVNPNPEVPKQ
jgi:hypothetical protein